MSKSVQLEQYKPFQPLQQQAEHLKEAITLQYKNDDQQHWYPIAIHNPVWFS